MYKYENLFVFEDDFEWDKDKETENILKHGLSFLDAVRSFEDIQGFTLYDFKHSTEGEPRFYWTGLLEEEKIVVTTWYTIRGSRTRIIGCAQLRKFRRMYESTKIK